MKRRTFTAEFKTKIILEVLRGEKELNVIATENELAPNQIRNWKAEFLKTQRLHLKIKEPKNSDTNYKTSIRRQKSYTRRSVS